MDFDDDVEHQNDGESPDLITDSESEDDSGDDSAEDFNKSDISIEETNLEKISTLGSTDDEILNNIGCTLKRVRNLVKMTRNSSNILNYMRVKQNDAQINYQFLKDFKIRWNYTYLFLERVLKNQHIISELTKNPSNIAGLSVSQINSLKRLHLTQSEWQMIMSLIEVLGPFYYATKMLSGRYYQTQSISYVVINGLKSYLLNECNENEDNEDDDIDIDNQECEF